VTLGRTGPHTESSVGKENKDTLYRRHWRNHPGLQISDHVELPGDILFAHARQLGAEGIVSKRLGSRYQLGPSEKSGVASSAARRGRGLGQATTRRITA
jgi:hypothetical protein